MKKQTAKKHLVVVGGGFASIKVIRELKNHPKFHITLISDDENFRYSPALYRTATGHKKREASVPLSYLLEGFTNVTFVHARATKINRLHRLLKTHDGQTFRYDYCVMALGVVTSYFGIVGLDEYSYGIKSVSEVERLKAHLHRELLEGEIDKNYVVVGAGPTGVELAAALRSYLSRLALKHKIRLNKINIELIEAADRVLPGLSPAVSKRVHKRLHTLGVKVMTNKKVEAETENSLRVDDRSIPTHTVIWTAGTANNPFFANNADQFQFDQRHKIVVDDHLCVDDHLMVIGDNASTQYSGLALTAIHNAAYTGHYLRNIIKHQPIEPYKPFKAISVVPVGPAWAVVQWGNLVFGGWFGAVLRVSADLIGYSDVMGWRKAFAIWSRRNEYEEGCPTCRAVSHTLPQ